MESTFRELTNYLVALGINDVKHTDKGFLAHLIGVYQDLKVWGCDEAVCRAGLFHSIYGTELFKGFALTGSKTARSRLFNRRPSGAACLYKLCHDSRFFRQVTGATTRAQDHYRPFYKYRSRVV